MAIVESVHTDTPPLLQPPTQPVSESVWFCSMCVSHFSFLCVAML